MKKILVFLSLFFVSTFISCDSEVDSNDLSELVIDAKWLIEDSDTYESFEFNAMGDYIVVLSTSSTSSNVIVGTYFSSGNNTVVMDGFGEVEIVSSDSQSVSFNLTLEGQTETITLYSTVAETVSTSAKTELLCRKWNFAGFSIDGQEYDIDADDNGIITFPTSILFSKAGTYLVTYSTEEQNSIVIQWKWKSEDEGTFYYAREDDWSANEYATIVSLTSEKMVVSENMGDSPTESTFEAAN